MAKSVITPSMYERRLKELRPYVSTNIKSRKHFTSAEKGKITKLWNQHKDSIRQIRRGAASFTRISNKRNLQKLKYDRKTNKGVFTKTSKSKARVRSTKEGPRLTVYYKKRKDVFIPIPKGVHEGNFIHWAIATTKRHKAMSFAIVLRGYRSQMSFGANLDEETIADIAARYLSFLTHPITGHSGLPPVVSGIFLIYR